MSEAAAKERLWRGRIKAWKASGKSAARFAEGEEITASSLLYWSRRLKAASPAAGATPESSKPTFAQVVPRGMVPKGSVASAGIVLEVGGVSIRPGRTDIPAVVGAQTEQLSRVDVDDGHDL